MSDIYRDIDRYFDGKADLTLGARVHEVIQSDAQARAYFERRRVVADLDPLAPSAKARVGAALGFDVPPPPRESVFSWLPLGSMAGVAAAAALVVFISVGDVGPQDLDKPPDDAITDGTDDGFRGRGQGEVGAKLTSTVQAFRIASAEAGKKPATEQVKDSIRITDELAFAYTNPNKRAFLMVYGVDEAGGVYWYHPAWTDPAANPKAVRIDPGPQLRELKEAIAHEVSGKKLKLYALFSDQAASVREVEDRLQARKTPVGELIEIGTLNVVP